jgi:hypothetical protein
MADEAPPAMEAPAAVTADEAPQKMSVATEVPRDGTAPSRFSKARVRRGGFVCMAT